FDIPSILLPGCRVIGGLLVKTESDEFDLKQWWAAGYSNNELPLYTAKLKLQYDSSSELMRFTDWNGIHHYFSKRQ
ncbi:MAG: hypothetical protein LBD23_15785, partial [Oscillospiraceae bacterium]|nr:hypothetical protein [Oscillospiraceae bacterium]